MEGSSSHHPADASPHSQLWWDRIPSLKIVRPPKGIFSPAVDERCFTYCSQSLTGRIHGAQPWCRSLCLRRVFRHEVSRILAHHRTQTVTNVPGRRPVVHVKDEVESVPVDHPLPPEGQRFSGWLAMLLGGGGDPDSDPLDTPPPPPQSRHPRSWQEGWYVWWSTSAWAVQEKIDVMRRDLTAQTDWQRFKQQKNDEWARGLPYDDDAPAAPADPHAHPDPLGLDELSNVPPFPDVSGHTVLLPFPSVPTSFAALSPTARVLALVHDSVQSGAQGELWLRIWEKARTDEPMKLLVVAWERVVDNFWPGDKGDGTNVG